MYIIVKFFFTLKSEQLKCAFVFSPTKSKFLSRYVSNSFEHLFPPILLYKIAQTQSERMKRVSEDHFLSLAIDS